MAVSLDGFVWLLLSLGPLIFLQRILHREIQVSLLLLTRRVDVALALFSLLFLPGVFLHEISHYLMARLLGVQTGRFSIFPRPLPDGRLQLGFVETASSDWLRDALIGAAPLIMGGVFVANAGLSHLGFLFLWEQTQAGGLLSLLQALPDVFNQPDLWLWFYLVFAVSTTMLPSAADRRAWYPLGLVMVLLLGFSILFGAGPWLMANLAIPFNVVLKSVAIVFVISDVIHLILFPPFWILHHILSWLTGMNYVG